MEGRAFAILVALCAALALSASAATADPFIVISEPLESDFSATVSPRTLSKTEPAPVVLRTALRFWGVDGSQVPALKELKLRFDRRLRLDVEALPACSLAGRGRPEPERTCREAVVARGTMKVDVRFTEVPPILVTAKATVYKGDTSKGGPPLFLYTRFGAPITGEIISRIELKPIGEGVYGREAVVSVPKIAGGEGSITHLGLRFRRGVFEATCPRSGSLFVAATSLFADGALLAGAVSRFCD